MRDPEGGGAPPPRHRAVLPVDVATHIYLAAIAILICAFGLPSAWPYLLGAIASSAVLIAIQIGTRRRSGMTQAIVRAAYLTCSLPIFYLQLKAIIPAIHPRSMDGALNALDVAIFGTDPTLALQAIAHPILTEVLQIAYMTYYPLPFVLPIILLRKRRLFELEVYALALLLTYYLTFLGYIAVPANGPREVVNYDFELEGILFGRTLLDMIMAADAGRFDCFPSGHTAVAVLAVLYAWQFRMRVLVWVLAVDGLLIIAATVYMRYHHAVDLPPGALLAIAAFLSAQWVYRRGPSPGSTSPA